MFPFQNVSTNKQTETDNGDVCEHGRKPWRRGKKEDRRRKEGRAVAAAGKKGGAGGWWRKRRGVKVHKESVRTRAVESREREGHADRVRAQKMRKR